MPVTDTFNPSRAAKQIGTPASTLRHWSKVYAEFLSPGANPGRNEERAFTVADIELLRAVVQLRANGLQPVEIVERLRQDPSAALQTPLATPTTGVEPMPGTSIAPTSPHALETFLSVNTRQLDDVARQVASVDDRLKRVESTRWWIVAVIVAFAAGAVTVAAGVMILR